jgi:hypothetical protein
MTRKENRNTSKIVANVLYTNDVFTGTLVGSPRWFTWLSTGPTFYYETRHASFTACRERRRRGYYWYAFRKGNGKLYKRYLGRDIELTAERLSSVAQALESVTSIDA